MRRKNWMCLVLQVITYQLLIVEKVRWVPQWQMVGSTGGRKTGPGQRRGAEGEPVPVQKGRKGNLRFSGKQAQKEINRCNEGARKKNANGCKMKDPIFARKRLENRIIN